MQSLSVLIASRLAPSTRPQANGALLVEAAIQSIRSQTLAARAEIRIVVGVDRGKKVPPALANRDDITFVESAGRTQAAALNAAAGHIDGDVIYVADLLERNELLRRRFGDRSWYRLAVTRDAAGRLGAKVMPY